MLDQWCQDFFGRGPHFSPKNLAGHSQHRILVNAQWQLQMENFSVWPATEVRPANRAGRTSQFRGPHYNANFWTLGGPQFMTSRAAFGPRAALFTPLT